MLQDSEDEEGVEVGNGNNTVQAPPLAPVIKQEPEEEEPAEVHTLRQGSALQPAVHSGQQGTAQAGGSGQGAGSQGQAGPETGANSEGGGAGNGSGTHALAPVPARCVITNRQTLLVPLDGSTAQHVSSVRLKVGGVMLAPECTDNWKLRYSESQKALMIITPPYVPDWLDSGDLQAEVLQHIPKQQEHMDGPGASEEHCTLLLSASWPMRDIGQTVREDC